MIVVVMLHHGSIDRVLGRLAGDTPHNILGRFSLDHIVLISGLARSAPQSFVRELHPDLTSCFILSWRLHIVLAELQNHLLILCIRC